MPEKQPRQEEEKDQDELRLVSEEDHSQTGDHEAGMRFPVASAAQDEKQLRGEKEDEGRVEDVLRG